MEAMKTIQTIGQSVTVALAYLFIVSLCPARANAASMALYPERGYALLNKPFAVDIMLDTGGEDTTEARAVFKFDRTRVKVTKAEYADLFCQYPEDQYAVDNSAGWIKLTGYCNDPYYNSNGTPGLFGRFTFEPIMEGIVQFDFVDSYEDEDWISRILDTSSPPQELSGMSFSGGTYTVVSSVEPVNNGDKNGTKTKLPGVGILDDKRILLGATLIAAGAFVFVLDRVIRRSGNRKNTQSRTVVVR